MKATECQPYLEAMAAVSGQKCTVITFPTSLQQVESSGLYELPEYAVTVDYDIRAIIVIYQSTNANLDLGITGIEASDVVGPSTMYYTDNDTLEYYLKTVDRRTVYPVSPTDTSTENNVYVQISRVVAALLFG